MPDFPPVAAPNRTLARVAGLALAWVGGGTIIAAAFLQWFTVTVRPPERAVLGGLPAEVRAEITGIGTISMPELGGRDFSDYVPGQLAWLGWAALGLAAVAIMLSAVAAFSTASAARLGAVVTGACGLLAAAIGGYALIVPPGRERKRAYGVVVDTVTAADAGPFVVLAGAAATALGAVVLLLARRSAPAAASPTAAQRAVAPRVTPPAAPPQVLPSAWARPAPAAPRAPHLVTAISPVAQRRPKPEWDRDWPTLAPPKAPAPSEQRTTVVKRPPRPVRISPAPETTPLDHGGAPNFDGPTQPL